MQPSGLARSSVQRNHALITPDGHVRAPLLGWTQTQAITLISPQMGARFCQFLAVMTAGATSGLPLPTVERFVYVSEGTLALETATNSTELAVGSYVYLPPALPHTLRALTPSTLILFERPYHLLPNVAPPALLIGREQDVVGEPFLGDPDANLKTLLPIEFAFDMAVNLFTFQPGAALPFVEMHVMEHGLSMLQGGGIYRLADAWYPVQAGDTIWMAAYCPQWFGALGKTPARYLYYKDIHRDPLEVHP